MPSQSQSQNSQSCPDGGIYFEFPRNVRRILLEKYSDQVSEYPLNCWHVKKKQAPRVSPPKVDSSFTATPRELEFLDIINKYRKNKGLGEVVLNKKLMTASRRNADFMRRTNVMSHFLNDSPDGVTPMDRAHKFGYTAGRIGENILQFALGYNPQTAFNAWLSSPPHHATILTPDWKVIGIAESPDTTVWVNMFGNAVDGNEI